MQTVPESNIKTHYSITINESLKLSPYLKEHVPMYNKWMSNEVLCHLTSSQHLTLQQQYECQANWTTDPTRDTFLISYDGVPIGDVNCFFSPWLEDNQCQINIMIAEQGYRGKGIAPKIIQAMEEYSSSLKNRDTMIARIKEGNNASISLFRKLRYEQIKFNYKQKQYEFRKKLAKVAWKEFQAKYDVKIQTIV